MFSTRRQILFRRVQRPPLIVPEQTAVAMLRAGLPGAVRRVPCKKKQQYHFLAMAKTNI